MISPISAWTDYPIVELGDRPSQPAPHRDVKIIGYDGDKYYRVIIGPPNILLIKDIKAGYLYKTSFRHIKDPIDLKGLKDLQML